MRPVRERLAWTLAGFGMLALAAIVLAPLVGSAPVSLRTVFDRSIPYADNTDAQIFFVARLPRVLAAALVGSALAAAGVVFQALLRNPLASTDTLGVSAGASLGAMLAITFHADFAPAGLPALPLASFAGSLGALAIVYGLSAARRRGTSALVLLLGGVTVQALLGAVISFVQYLADFAETFRNVRWLMGSLDVASYTPIWASLVPFAIASAGFATLPRVLDLISVGRESALARGVDVERAERVALVSASLATGAAVSLAGPVSFVGIIVPHTIRLLVSRSYRVVIPLSLLFGASFLILADTAARSVVAPAELPIGVITAFVGAPFFIAVLRSTRAAAL